MNIDPLSPPPPAAALPARSVHTPPDQVSNRPVERPHHGEAADNQNRNNPASSDKAKEAQQQPANQNRSARQESELSPEEKRQVDKLKARDQEVRAHEAAHKNAAGHLARGSAQFSYQVGPDGRRYAVGGEVSIDTSEVAGDPEATISKARTIRRAAQAPVDPSAQDHRIAAEATRMEAAARSQLAEQRSGEADGSAAPQSTTSATLAEPAPVGTLLDVIV